MELHAPTHRLLYGLAVSYGKFEEILFSAENRVVGHGQRLKYPGNKLTSRGS